MTHTIERLTTLTLEVVPCAECGIEFGLSSSYVKQRRQDGKTFYCPNGHTLGWHETELDRARQRAAALERRTAAAERHAANADENARAARASLIATKGHLTRSKRRAAHGVCPCCSRSFANVQRHVASQHPGFVAEHGAQSEVQS